MVSIRDIKDKQKDHFDVWNHPNSQRCAKFTTGFLAMTVPYMDYMSRKTEQYKMKQIYKQTKQQSSTPRNNTKTLSELVTFLLNSA